MDRGGASPIRAYFRRRDGGCEAADPEQRALDAEADRRVGVVLEAAGPMVAEVLELCFATDIPPELEVYGLLAHLVAQLPKAIAAHEVSGTDLDLPSWLGRLPKRGRQDSAAQRLVDDLLAQATCQFAGALLNYRGARRRLGGGRR